MAKFTCPYCDYHTHSERGLKRHITIKHKEEKERDQAKSTNLDNTVSLEEVAGKVEIPIENSEHLLDDPPPTTPEEPSREEPEEAPVEEAPKEIFVDSPENPVEIDPTEVVSEALEVIDLESLGINSIPVGAIVKLKGTYWFKTPEQSQYSNMQAEDVICEVYEKLIQNGYTYLQLKVENSDVEWCCLEQDILNGKIELIHLSKPTSVPEDTTDIIVDPPEEPESVSEPAVEENPAPTFDAAVEAITEPSEPVQEEAKVQEPSIEESMEDIDESRTRFTELVQEYAKARDAKLDAEKDYKLVDNANRKSITEYLEKHGSPSGEGKGDHQLVVDGYKVHWTFTPGKVSIKRDVEAIIKWCFDNGHFYALQAALNEEVWDKMVENGMVPADTLAELQEPVQGKDSRRLLVEKLKP